MKEHTIVDEQFNLYIVNDWDRLIENITIEELEYIYITTKASFLIETRLNALIKKKIIIPSFDKNAYPFKSVNNTLENIKEILGEGRIKELDINAETLSKNTPPPFILSLN